MRFFWGSITGYWKERFWELPKNGELDIQPNQTKPNYILPHLLSCKFSKDSAVPQIVSPNFHWRPEYLFCSFSFSNFHKNTSVREHSALRRDLMKVWKSWTGPLLGGGAWSRGPKSALSKILQNKEHYHWFSKIEFQNRVNLDSEK